MIAGMPGTDPALIALLAHVGLFAGCSRKELSAVAAATYETDIEAGTVMTTQGEEGKDFFVIVEGVATWAIDGQPQGTLAKATSSARCRSSTADPAAPR